MIPVLGYRFTLICLSFPYVTRLPTPQHASCLSIPFLVSVWLLLSIWLCVRLPAILPKPLVSVLLSGRLTKMSSWHCHTKRAKTKQSKTQLLSLQVGQHVKVTDWSLLKTINHHWCTLWQDSTLNLPHMHSNTAAKCITELLKTDSQSVTSHPHWSNHILILQRFHLHGDNFKIFFFFWCVT